MTSPVSGASSVTDPTTSTSTTAKAGALDKEAFLKLLVAQISNQDPMKPMEGTEFVTQLSQMSAVEQAIAQTKSLETLSAQMSGVSNAQTMDLVGKTVTVTGTDGKDVEGVVKQVSFDQGYPVIGLVNGTSVPVSSLKIVQQTPAATK
jgi:flagellar basal-body rod modification protein FlgD